MAITKSAQKALRQSERRRAGNKIYAKKIKNLVKDFYSFVAQKKAEEAKKLMPAIYKILDKAAKVNVIKKNTASRKKSRIAKAISKIK